MKNHGIVAAIVIFVLIIAGMFIFAFLKKSEIAEPTTNESPQVETPTPYDSITRIDARHYFLDGKHTLVGELLMPTPCDLLNWDTRVAESMPEQVTVAFTVVNNTEMCAQVMTPQLFSASFNASENPTINATLNGRAVELNLIPAAPGERPEDYEFSGKG
jgi:hypothetical protein